ncbi:MAG: 3-phosphoshikimate 1-carboxyvinyltransferase [Cyclobacteriaceae bacterium]
MDIKLKSHSNQIKGHIRLNSSKSESNRVLIINALSGNLATVHNLSNARDTETMQRLLSEDHKETWDVLDAGTTMRFLTAFATIGNQARILTGTERMQQRPIKILVDALEKLGAKISYLRNDGYPPIKVHPIEKQLTDHLKIPGNISSQYISALLMIAPSLPMGLTITIEGTVFSRPYIEMTLSLMAHFGVAYYWNGQEIAIAPQSYAANDYTIESDWSGASYWYSIAALSEDCDIYLEGLRKDSNQGDQAIARIMEHFGVVSTYDEKGIRLTKSDRLDKEVAIAFKSCPDLAQTVMACAASKGINLKMTGLESLRIKETDRIAAMKTETAKFGGTLEESEDHWYFTSNPRDTADTITIETYEDHRMAMAFAPLSIQYSLLIKDKEVVDKSYPDFWRDLEKVGITG